MGLCRDEFLEVLSRPEYARLFILQRLAESNCVVQLIRGMEDERAVETAKGFYFAAENLRRVGEAKKLQVVAV